MRQRILGVTLGCALFTMATWASVASSITAGAAVASPCGPTKSVPKITHIVVIAFENHSYQSVLGGAAPAGEFKTLAAQCGTATNYTASGFPHSLPNYLAATGGTVAGITGDCLPSKSCQVDTASIFQQLGAPRWRVWAQSMPQPCSSQNAGNYVARHNPPVYFTGIKPANCALDDLPLPAQPPVPKRSFTWISPDLQHDMTLDTVANAGSWLKTFLSGPHGLLKSSSYTAGHTAIFIWFDTAADTDTATTPAPLIVIAPSTGHRVVKISLTDAHLLRGWENLLGLPCLAQACSKTGFNAAFRL